MKRSNFQSRKEARRRAAEERNAAWRSLSPEQQLRILETRPGFSVKQTARIRRQLEAEGGDE